VLLLVGCSAPPQKNTDPVAVPQDLVIDATILVGDHLQYEMEKQGEDGWPAHLRPWRAIVMPDGSLRSDSGASLGVDDRPGLTRVLYRDQVAVLWKSLEDLKFASPDSGRTGEFRGNPALITVGTGEVAQILTIQAHGDGWTIACRFTPHRQDNGSLVSNGKAPGENPSMRAFLRRLLALAWATDLPPEHRFAAPERYDFGPDPWSRYRSPSGEKDKKGEGSS
jgi:hypothetical protein